MPTVKKSSNTPSTAKKSTKTPNTPKKSTRSAKQRRPVDKSKPQQRKELYPKLEGRFGWLKPEDAKKFLGWKQADDGKDPYKDYLFKDAGGVPTKCYNVEKQRPFYAALCHQHKAEILGGHWNGDGGEANGEPIIIGKTGIVLDGKHRMIGLVLAEQEWLKHPEKYPFWQESPKFHTFINIGVREDIKSVNTINTGKPRSLADAIYASGLFGDLGNTKTKEKRNIKKLSKMMDYAVRLLWHRTGAAENAFAARRTHAESLDFIERHPRLLECVKHIYEENGEKDRLKSYPSPGYAAALLYMMASSESQRENDDNSGYIQVDCATEDLLEWTLWDKACDFWTLLAAFDKQFDPLREAVGNLLDSEGGSFLRERIALIVKSWWCYVNDEPITNEAIKYETVLNKDGVLTIAENPTIGEVFGDASGIDLGDPA